MSNELSTALSSVAGFVEGSELAEAVEDLVRRVVREELRAAAGRDR